MALVLRFYGSSPAWRKYTIGRFYWAFFVYVKKRERKKLEKDEKRLGSTARARGVDAGSTTQRIMTTGDGCVQTRARQREGAHSRTARDQQIKVWRGVLPRGPSPSGRAPPMRNRAVERGRRVRPPRQHGPPPTAPNRRRAKTTHTQRRGRGRPWGHGAASRRTRQNSVVAAAHRWAAWAWVASMV